MLPNPLVTAVITTHQRPNLLRRALASVRAEKYRDLEIVVVEDGAALRPDDIAGDRPARLLTVSAGGCAPARNAGLAAARGSYVVFLDDDDVALPNRITDLLDAARSGGYAIAYGRTSKTRSDGREMLIPAWPRKDFARVGFRDMLVHMPHVDSVLLETDALRRAGGFDLATPNFDELSAWLHMLSTGATAVFRDRIVAEWHTHDRGLSGIMSRDGSMKRSLETLLERAVGVARGSDRDLAAAILARVRSSEIQSFDEYVQIAREAAYGQLPE